MYTRYRVWIYLVLKLKLDLLKTVALGSYILLVAFVVLYKDRIQNCSWGLCVAATIELVSQNRADLAF